LLTKKSIYIQLLLLALLIPMAITAQDRQISRAISWGKPIISIINDSAVKNMAFEGAYFPEMGKLPLWTETFYADNLSSSISLTDCIYRPLSPEETRILSSFSDQVPAELYFSSHQVISRKDKGVHIEILPFIRDAATNQVNKLVSFTIKFAEEDGLAKGTVRNYASNSMLAQGEWYKIAVTQTGIYRIEYNDLVAMGINPSTLNPDKIGIFGRDGAMLPEAKAGIRADELPEKSINLTGKTNVPVDKAIQFLLFA